jgi:hypothetical protein
MCDDEIDGTISYSYYRRHYPAFTPWSLYSDLYDIWFMKGFKCKDEATMALVRVEGYFEQSLPKN